MTLLPVCAEVALVIACAALFRPLPRLAVHGYTLALLVGLPVFGGTLCVSILFWAQLGFWTWALAIWRCSSGGAPLRWTTLLAARQRIEPLSTIAPARLQRARSFITNYGLVV